MKANLLESIKKTIIPIIENESCEFVDIEYKKNRFQKELIIYCDREGGISLEMCGKINRLISEQFDKDEPIRDTYILVVSSPGLDRNLKTDRDFEKALGDEIEFKGYQPFSNGKKEFMGTLRGYDDDYVFVHLSDGMEVKLPRKEIASAKRNIVVSG